jgi:hypothetical protein
LPKIDSNTSVSILEVRTQKELEELRREADEMAKDFSNSNSGEIDRDYVNDLSGIISREVPKEEAREVISRALA